MTVHKNQSRLITSPPTWLILGTAAALSGCAIAPNSGPSARTVANAPRQSIDNAGIKIVDLTDSVARQILQSKRSSQFSSTLGDGIPAGSIVGKGDVLDIAIWEAPPAALFGTASTDSRALSAGSGNATARATSIPEQMVDSEGRVTVPFMGSIMAAGRTPQQIAQAIVAGLSRQANKPQAVIRVVRNSTTSVTVVGDVTTSARVPLTAKGERLLDVLATVGGVKQPVDKMTIQITRGQRVATMPLGSVIRDPLQNIRLQSDDVVTALFQPFSFTALGAVGKNEELPFEGTGLSLIQALGRVSGLQDARADVKGVFVFRFEDPEALDPATRQTAKTTPDGKVPVIYRIDLKDPATFFVAQSFPIRDKDVLYISNAPLADIQKFVNVISSTILPIATIPAIVP